MPTKIELTLEQSQQGCRVIESYNWYESQVRWLTRIDQEEVFVVRCVSTEKGFFEFFDCLGSREGVEDLREHGGSKQVGFKQLGPEESIEYMMKNVFSLRWNCRELKGIVKLRIFQVSNDDTSVAQRRLEDKQSEEKTNTDCLVNEQENEYQTGWKIKMGNVLDSCNQRDLIRLFDGFPFEAKLVCHKAPNWPDELFPPVLVVISDLVFLPGGHSLASGLNSSSLFTSRTWSSSVKSIGSGAPIRIGTDQLSDPPIIAGITIKNIIKRHRGIGITTWGTHTLNYNHLTSCDSVLGGPTKSLFHPSYTIILDHYPSQRFNVRQHIRGRQQQKVNEKVAQARNSKSSGEVVGKEASAEIGKKRFGLLIEQPLCIKESSFMMALLIPGPESPSKNINVYLRPLIDDLKDLWEKPGVKTIDIDTGQKINMRAMVLWIIDDFPSRNSLSGWNRKCYKQYLPVDVAKPIIELCLFFNQISSQTLMEDGMLKAQSKAPEGGPIRPQWMYPFERFMKKLKNYVQSNAKAEGSFEKSYVAEEALTFSSHYFRDVTMKFNRPDRNVDCPPPTCHVDKDLGVSASSELFALACSPTPTPISVNSCVVNGVRFIVHSQDDRRTTQNCGICSPCEDEKMYYGQLEQILEFSYMLFKTVLFRVKWFDTSNNGRVKHLVIKNNITQILANEDGPGIIHVDNLSNLALTTTLNDWEIAALHIDGQTLEVDAPPNIIDADEDDDIIDDEDVLPHDLADFDDEDLVNVDDDEGVAVVYSSEEED
uniref:DUF4218 domain-containing protein n=1 Tax=Tanacetum cinerariifolium TaxID=118510 RepID=A0A6L2LIP7_TANCI|nr:hypothetical protein [Tanacetum cinerariifolium]